MNKDKLLNMLGDICQTCGSRECIPDCTLAQEIAKRIAPLVMLRPSRVALIHLIFDSDLYKRVPKEPMYQDGCEAMDLADAILALGGEGEYGHK